MTDKQHLPPKPEQLKTRSDKEGPVSKTPLSDVIVKSRDSRATRYRPSHRGTFIGLSVIAVIILINGVIVWYVMQSQTDTKQEAVRNGVTLSADSLDSIGVSRSQVGEDQSTLFVGPKTNFDSSVTIKGDASVSGKLTLNGTFAATDAKFQSLQAGKTQLQELNVNGDATISNLSTREDLQVAGSTSLQGPVTAGELVTINNNLNVAGNLAVGGTLSARSFQASSLVSDTTLTVGGHIVTRGRAPSTSGGNALGTSGTVSISGTDSAGTIAAGIGGGASSGTIANVSFRQTYGNTPKVVVTPIGRPAPDLYVNRTASGFTLLTGSGLPAGSYAFDYIVFE